MKKFRVNDIVITGNGSLAKVDKVDDEGDCSVTLICQDNTKIDKLFGKKWDYDAWHCPSELKLVGRVKGLKQLIKLLTIAYKENKL